MSTKIVVIWPRTAQSSCVFNLSIRKNIAKLGYIFCILPTACFAVADCDVELATHLKSDMQLSYQEFDQTMGQGMRLLSNKGCHSESADLIEAYIAFNDAKQPSLRWHIAQQRGMAGDYDRAIEAAKSVISDSPDIAKSLFRWNDYVLAVISFFERDKPSLVEYRNRVALGKDEHPGNAINLRQLDALLENFGESYAVALSYAK